MSIADPDEGTPMDPDTGLPQEPPLDDPHDDPAEHTRGTGDVLPEDAGDLLGDPDMSPVEPPQRWLDEQP